MTKFLKLSENHIINVKFIKSIEIYERGCFEKYIAAHITIANSNQTDDKILIFGEGSNEFNKIKEFIAEAV